MSDYWIGASEIGTFVYCHKAWWLQQVEGIRPLAAPQLARGAAHHAAHNRLWQRSERYRWLAYTLLLFALGVFVLWLVTL